MQNMPNVGTAPLNNSDKYNEDEEHKELLKNNKNNKKYNNDEDEDVGVNYSILPIRDRTVVERWKYRMRRWTFYVMSSCLACLVIYFPFTLNDISQWFWILHILYVDLDVTVSKNQNFIRFLHGPSFIGSFIIAAVGTILVVREPSFIHTRAGTTHRDDYQLWIIHSVTNFVPPFLHALDLYYNHVALRKRQALTPPWYKFPKGTSHSSPLRQFIRIVWMFISPVALIIGWFCLKVHPEYDILHDFPLAAYLPALIVIDILAGVLLVACLMSGNTDKYAPLLGNQ